MPAHNFVNVTKQNEFTGTFIYNNDTYEYVLYLPPFVSPDIIEYFGTRTHNKKTCLDVDKATVTMYIKKKDVSAFIIVNQQNSDEKASCTLQIYDHCSPYVSTRNTAQVWINDLCRIAGTGSKTQSVNALLFFAEQLTVQNLNKTDIYLFVDTSDINNKNGLISLYISKGFDIDATMCPDDAVSHLQPMIKKNISANTNAIDFGYLLPNKITYRNKRRNGGTRKRRHKQRKHR